MEEMLTTRPRLPFFIRGTACCVVNRAAVRLIAIVEFHRSSSTSASGAVLATPALFTRTSHRSSSSVSHANSAATDSAADTSTPCPMPSRLGQRFCGHSLGPVAVEIGDDDCEPVRRQPASKCFAYPGRTAGDYGYR